MNVVIETERLVLRPLTVGDLSVYQRLVADPTVAVPAGLPLQASAARTTDWFKADRENRFAFGLVAKQTNQLVGTLIFYEHFDPENIDTASYDLGFLLDPAYWGQGLMPEAIAGCLQRVANDGDQATTTFWATCRVDNDRSRRVLEKLAFQTINEHLLPMNEASSGLVQQALLRLDLTKQQKN
ncbi:hypothetical protein FD13_GL000909 [Levilactobacillus senmaizukei DSM 21775 = NBRC 103853]|uniref:N-acetyltransferase domain-containing protein n=1 Tax=Levilactobacillus senmaizukei DSM 21775 = NBRC 103853 TaxID=1423803 RepID=A0A0R2DGI6_9LACO|nr:GNAT family N-acetyltransferase [Levilactobacillus senmaizukei]KRN03154.1 hypothetical protein FD13_GL000909 [Levilactobacillus senmaizukei DSM 21775 = NBRC 103853]